MVGAFINQVSWVLEDVINVLGDIRDVTGSLGHRFGAGWGRGLGSIPPTLFYIRNTRRLLQGELLTRIALEVLRDVEQRSPVSVVRFGI